MNDLGGARQKCRPPQARTPSRPCNDSTRVQSGPARGPRRYTYHSVHPRSRRERAGQLVCPALVASLERGLSEVRAISVPYGTSLWRERNRSEVMQLDGKVAVVTGGGSGLGRATAKRL